MRSHPGAVARLRPGPMRAGLALAALLAAAAGSALGAAAGPVPAEYQGTWVPARSACDTPPLRVTITSSQLTLANGSDRQALGGIEMAGPGYFPPDYRGIMAVLITEFDGHQPVTAHFNVGERKGVAQLDIAAVAPGGTQTPQLKAYNAHIAKLALGRRFPLDKVPLKRCP